MWNGSRLGGGRTIKDTVKSPGKSNAAGSSNTKWRSPSAENTFLKLLTEQGEDEAAALTELEVLGQRRGDEVRAADRADAAGARDVPPLASAGAVGEPVVYSGDTFQVSETDSATNRESITILQLLTLK